MQNNEYLREDEDIEISDVPATGPAGHEGATNQGLIQRVSLRTRYTRQQRYRRLLITSGIVLTVLLVLLGSYAPIQNLVMSRLRPSTPVPQVASGPDFFYFPTLPGWGTFTLDGKPLQRVPVLSGEQPLKLPQGAHQLAWHGEPFKPLQCTLFVPSNPAKQTCKVRPFAGTGVREASLVEFPVVFSLKQLPETQQRGLVQSIQSLLDTLQAIAIVQPGEPYSDLAQPGVVKTATQQLLARQRFLLDTDTSTPANCIGMKFGPRCSLAGNDCRLFCTMMWPRDESDTVNNDWHIAAVMRPIWQYASVRDQTALQEQPLDRWGGQYFVILRISRWQQGWQVAFHPQGTSSFDDPNCASAIGTIMSSEGYRTIEKTQQRITWTFSSGANRAEGCLAAATLQSNNHINVVPPRAADAYLLQRFGVLLAANEAAHKLWPDLPLADNNVKGIARDIAQHSVFVS